MSQQQMLYHPSRLINTSQAVTWGPQMLLMQCCSAEAKVPRSPPEDPLHGMCGVEGGAKKNSVFTRKSTLGVKAKLQ